MKKQSSLIAAVAALVAVLSAPGCAPIEKEFNDIIGSNSGSTSHSAPRVAVIDDSKTSRYAVVNRLPQHRVAVDQYASGAAFLLEFLDKGFDLIVCDVKLGDGIGGVDVLAEVRRRSSKRVPFVLVSASYTDEQMRGYIAAGADRVLSKSHLDDLRGIANELLGFR